MSNTIEAMSNLFQILLEELLNLRMVCLRIETDCIIRPYYVLIWLEIIITGKGAVYCAREYSYTCGS